MGTLRSAAAAVVRRVFVDVRAYANVYHGQIALAKQIPATLRRSPASAALDLLFLCVGFILLLYPLAGVALVWFLVAHGDWLGLMLLFAVLALAAVFGDKCARHITKRPPPTAAGEGN